MLAINVLENHFHLELTKKAVKRGNAFLDLHPKVEVNLSEIFKVS